MMSADDRRKHPPAKGGCGSASGSGPNTEFALEVPARRKAVALLGTFAIVTATEAPGLGVPVRTIVGPPLAPHPSP